MKRLLIIGAGGHGQVVKEIAIVCGYETINFLDDKAPNAVGKISEAPFIAPNYNGVIVAIGDNEKRRDITAQLEKIEGINIVTLIHPTAFVSSSVTIGRGTVVEPNAIINANSKIGEGCIISVGAIVDHECSIGNYSHINAGAICMARSCVRSIRKVDAGYVVNGTF